MNRRQFVGLTGATVAGSMLAHRNLGEGRADQRVAAET